MRTSLQAQKSSRRRRAPTLHKYLTHTLFLHLPTPRDEVRHIVACKERATFRRRQEMYVAHGQNGTGGAGREGLRHRFVARLSSGQILLGGVTYVMGVLENGNTEKWFW